MRNAGLRSTYTGHELENLLARPLKQCRHILEIRIHARLILSDGACHASSHVLPQSVVDVELARGTRSKEGVVKACDKIVSHPSYMWKVPREISTISRSQSFSHDLRLHCLEGVDVLGELNYVQVEGQILLAVCLAQEFAEEQPEGGIVENDGETSSVGLAAICGSR